MPGKDDEADVGFAVEPEQDLVEKRVLEAVVNRASRWRSRHDHGIVTQSIDVQLVEDFGIGLEVANIKFFLQAWIEDDLGSSRALSADIRSPERFGHQDARRKPECQVIRRLVLEVGSRYDRGSEHAGGDDLCVRVV